jgi:hypothetical protein
MDRLPERRASSSHRGWKTGHCPCSGCERTQRPSSSCLKSRSRPSVWRSAGPMVGGPRAQRPDSKSMTPSARGRSGDPRRRRPQTAATSSPQREPSGPPTSAEPRALRPHGDPGSRWFRSYGSVRSVRLNRRPARRRRGGVSSRRSRNCMSRRPKQTPHAPPITQLESPPRLEPCIRRRPTSRSPLAFATRSARPRLETFPSVLPASSARSMAVP